MKAGDDDRDAIWTCPRCGYTYNLPDDRACNNCGVVRPGRQRTGSSGQWKCGMCAAANFVKNEYCNECGARKTSGVEVRLTLEGNKWRCACGQLTPVVMSRCQSCNKLSRDIDLMKEAFGLK